MTSIQGQSGQGLLTSGEKIDFGAQDLANTRYFEQGILLHEKSTKASSKYTSKEIVIGPILLNYVYGSLNIVKIVEFRNILENES